MQSEKSMEPGSNQNRLEKIASSQRKSMYNMDVDFSSKNAAAMQINAVGPGPLSGMAKALRQKIKQNLPVTNRESAVYDSITVQLDPNLTENFQKAKTKAQELIQNTENATNSTEFKRMKANNRTLQSSLPKQWNNIPVPVTDFCHELIIFNQL